MLPPGRFATVRQQLVIYSDFPLASQDQLLAELTARRGDVCDALGLPPSDEAIEVFLFDSSERFDAFRKVRYPHAPSRRAFFVQTEARLAVYAQWGQHVSDDLRHEVTHGYLHSIVPNLPLWLDEGLAEYFEMPRGSNVNLEHLRWLRARVDEGAWRPDLWRLEQLPLTSQMNAADYAESWAWVHLLLHSPGPLRDTLRTYLAELRTEGRAEPLSPRLRSVVGDPAALLLDHLATLKVAAAPTPETASKLAADGPLR